MGLSLLSLRSSFFADLRPPFPSSSFAFPLPSSAHEPLLPPFPLRPHSSPCRSLLFVLRPTLSFYAVQRALSRDPDTISHPPGPESSEMNALVESLRDIIEKQNAEIGGLNERLGDVQKRHAEEVRSFFFYSSLPLRSSSSPLFIDTLQTRISTLSSSLSSSTEKQKEMEKEQEDLLVFLEEISGKRKRDKRRLRELGEDVSEDEEEEGEEEEE
ncbi:hypothetical protein SISSUDRAFT_1067117 [Sistotremastrum suecicum HHB10207 ss-3]|uniref:Uso1/p115-like vesicle tethering protein C-terminal domain-containing protein n=1 Tax=Sistotremastrum suecicum HHB10207 ss-3 TaxID=1314776 RepID=A0A165XHK9_9AGAM|nr:hypothetical protein SISSUDRAFT_1067117 [Sistotremastrum suecicum HHB10207 ss-3]